MSVVAPPSCLLVVSHPDDDAIFAGQLQSHLSAAIWTVVCVTHDRSSERARELLRWQAALGTDPEHIHFLGHADAPDDWKQRRSSLDEATIAQQLLALDLAPDLVITHNEHGEYNHPHHQSTHRVARATYAVEPMLCFGMGLDQVDLILPCPEKPRTLQEYFPSQQKVLKKLARTSEKFAWQKDPNRPTRPTNRALADQLPAP